MNINCIIIDDEPLARKGLKEYITDIDFLNLSGEFENPLKATSLLNNQNIQLVFLDIQMPKITGIEWVKTLQHLPQVIFTTAYPQYALDGFELNALDYLVKPISFERFYKAALKAREYFEVRRTNIAIPQIGKGEEYFFIKSDNKLIKILFDDVLYVEALQNYVCIHTTDKKHITYLTFKSVEEYLPGTKFIKTHKSFIVSAAKVDSIDGTELLIDTHRIPVSRHLKDEVVGKLLSGKYLKR